LSNMYYKILANRPTYDMRGSEGFDMMSSNPNGNLVPFSVGDKNGSPVSMWGMRVSCSDCWNTTQEWAGGPCTWRLTTSNNPDAPNREKVMKTCYKMKDGKRARSPSKKCKNVEFSKEGIQKGDTGAIPKGKLAPGWSNMFMLNYEAGLYKKFEIDPVAMRSTGCAGIDLEDPKEMWIDGWNGTDVHSVITSRVNQCPITDVEDEKGNPIYQIVEEFADDHDVWASAFLDAWGRMQNVGYEEADLTEGLQNSWFGYYHLLKMDAKIGTNFEQFIEEHVNTTNKPVVFTSENVDPYVCGHQATRCATKISEAYHAFGIPMDIVGEPCKSFEECNSQSHGPLPE